VSPYPAQPGAITGSTSVCKSQSAVVYSISSVSGASSYTWRITGGATIVGSNTYTSVTILYTSSTSTSATLTVTANNSCGASPAASLTIAVNPACRTTATEDPAGNLQELIAYPNPANQVLNLAFQSGDEAKGVIRMLDMLGHEMLRRDIPISKGRNQYQLDLNEVAKGVYFLYLESTDASSGFIRVIVE
jgi:hypothetical protein